MKYPRNSSSKSSYRPSRSYGSSASASRARVKDKRVLGSYEKPMMFDILLRRKFNI